ncbi:MAG: hypothetical protein NTV31_17330 [Bacteroidia bacterium]|nr:hypothetical protein [Bacteroidia bacterium]
MRNLKINIALLLLIMVASLHAQESIFKLKGQIDAYSGLKFANPVQWQTGARFIPSVSIGKQWKNNLKFDSEISFDSYLNYHFTGWKNDVSGSGIKPYRLWLRLSTERFELRAGLQKISFGSAAMLRPLMWFDQLDPRDPLQLTDGVYALLSRYYFRNNANAWLWMLWGNDKPKGWETVPSVRKIPELGGRMQFPVPKGEVALSYHHRTADLNSIINPVDIYGAATYPEDRLGLDGKLDLGVGLWGEYALIHSSPDTAYFRPWSKLFTLGMDYTFNLGNGLYMATEFFRYSNANKLFEPGSNKTFSLLSVNYPVGNNKLGCIVYYNWTDKSWYRFINIQRQSDNWTFYLFLFWNPDKIAIYNTGVENDMFAGKGIQLMAVFNF